MRFKKRFLKSYIVKVLKFYFLVMSEQRKKGKPHYFYAAIQRKKYLKIGLAWFSKRKKIDFIIIL